jgi:hypothetical protein
MNETTANKPKTTALYVRIPVDLKEKVDQIAARYGISIAAVVTLSLHSGVDIAFPKGDKR